MGTEVAAISSPPKKKRKLQSESKSVRRVSNSATKKKRCDGLQKQLECVVCSDLMVAPRTLQCGHVTCHQCIEEWMEHSKTCPCCRAKIEREPSKVILIEHLIEQTYLTESDRKEYSERKAEYQQWLQESRAKKTVLKTGYQ